MRGTSRNSVIHLYTKRNSVEKRTPFLSQGIKNKGKNPRIRVIGCPDNKKFSTKNQTLDYMKGKNKKCWYFMVFYELLPLFYKL